MLTLPIKGKWFDMILSGEKKEEYRDLKPYWITRFENAFHLVILETETGYRMIPWAVIYEDEDLSGRVPVRLRCGYHGRARSAVAQCCLRIGTGRPEWGAVPGEQYLILEILEVSEA